MKKRHVPQVGASAEPPRPAWNAGGPVVEAALEAFRAIGFDPRVGSELLTSASRILADTLAESSDEPARDRVIALMRAALSVASNGVRGARDDARRRKLPLAPTACAEGCAHCCHLHVSLSAPEAIVLATFLRETKTDAELATLRARIEATAARVRGLDQAARVGIPCPLLEGTACGAYPVRPLVCAAANSLDAAACARAVETGVGELPIEPLQYGTIRGVQTALAVALSARGLDMGRHELAQSLAIALAHDDAAERFLDGERLFAAVTSAGDAPEERLRTTCEAFVARDPHLARSSALR